MISVLLSDDHIGEISNLVRSVSSKGTNGHSETGSSASSSNYRESMLHEKQNTEEIKKIVNFDDLHSSLLALDCSMSHLQSKAINNEEVKPFLPVVIGRSSTGTPLPWLDRPDGWLPSAPLSSAPASPLPYDSPIKDLVETLHNEIEQLRENTVSTSDNLRDDRAHHTGTYYYYDDNDGKSGYLSAYMDDQMLEAGEIRKENVYEDYDGGSSIELASQVHVHAFHVRIRIFMQNLKGCVIDS